MGNIQSQYEELKTYTSQNISYTFKKLYNGELFVVKYRFSLNDIDYVFYIYIYDDEHNYRYYCNAYKGKYDSVKLKLTTYPELEITKLCKRGFAYEFYLDGNLILDTVVYLKDGCEVGY
jgi:hypothetical protein